ncbi:MAG: outer membrane beta-barrel domain-containing protein [Gammaproteobacteria bacterium]|nr:outer membrane beta-barrel domain-containing protein [Gammaproteobacteria bacterium]
MIRIKKIIATGFLLFMSQWCFALEMPAMDSPVERHPVVLPKIDSEYFEIGAYVGALAVEDFGASSSSGFRAVLHASEDFFLEASIAQATITDEVYSRNNIHVFGIERSAVISYTSLVLAYNLFPGEVFLTDRATLDSSLYVLLGAGNTKFVGDDLYTIVYGMGFRVLPTDWLALRMEMRGHEYETDVLGIKKFSHNFEASLGLSLFF